MFARILTGLLLIVFSLLFATPTFAQTPPPASNLQLPTSISPTSPIYTDLLVYNLFHTFSCLSTGSSIIGQPCLTYQIQKNAQGIISSTPVLSQVDLSGGVLGTTGSLIGALYMNPPIRTVDYLGSLGEQLGMVKQVHAQVVGSGANVLNPILTLWQVSRNISYLIMIIIFVIIGLMVMFRQRINPQTVITAQAALPGLVIGLILITFSYFLAALLTDTAFIGTNLVGYYFSAAQPPPPPSSPGSPSPSCSSANNLVECTANESVLTIMGKLMQGFRKEDFTNAVAAFFNALGDPGDFIKLGIPPSINIDNPASLVRIGAGLAAYQVGSTIGPAIGATLAGLTCGVLALPAFASIVAAPIGAGTFVACVTAGTVLGGPIAGAALAAKTINDPPAMVGFAVWIIAMLAILYAMIQLLIKLLKNFLSIIFLTITAPFQFLAAALPGRQGIATGWILNMLCNVLSFPAVMAVFYFINYLLGPIINSPFYVSGGAALNVSTNLPVLGGLDTNFIRVILAFGALITTPAIPEIICRTIGRVGVAGQLLGQEFGGAVGGGRGYLGQAQSGLGGISRDVGGFGQFGTIKSPIYTGKVVTGYTTQAGLGARLPHFGKP